MSPIQMNMRDHKRVSSHLEEAIKDHMASKGKRVLASLMEVSSYRFPNMRIIYDRLDNKVLVETKTI